MVKVFVQDNFLGCRVRLWHNRFPSSSHIKTIKASSKIRYVYYGAPAQRTGTLYTELKDGTINGASFHRNSTIEETIESLESNWELVLFWIGWLLTGGRLSGSIISTIGGLKTGTPIIGGGNMGCFSWLKADKLTKVANVVEDKPFKFLIPQEFGGGFIKDHYQGYGYLGTKEDGSPKYDMYELLAFWNADKKIPFGNGETVRDRLRYDGDVFPTMKEIDEHTDENRSLGIDIGCYDAEIDRLKYPLKLVSASYTGTYEGCDGRSYGDPNQGWGALYRKDADQ